MKLALIVAVLLAVLIFGAAYAVDAPADEPIEPAAVSYTGGLKAYLPIHRDIAGVRKGFGLAASEMAYVNRWPGATELGAGWFYDWYVSYPFPQTRNMEYVPLINVNPVSPYHNTARVDGWFARALPGSPPVRGATWIIGNEMDVADQNPMTPQQYALAYDSIRDSIKAKDATAKTAIGPLVQVTTARLEWYRQFIVAYQSANGGVKPPADAWTMHIYPGSEDILPTGITGIARQYLGETWRAKDPQSFIDQVIRLRNWMAAQGYGATPLWITEFGTLSGSITEAETVDYLEGVCAWLNGTQGRSMVQKYAWFVYSPVSNAPYWTALIYPTTGKTAVGMAYDTCIP